MTYKYETVLFDLDGTILDTNELIIRSFLHALEGHVAEDFSRDHIIPFMGAPLIEQLKRFSGLDDVELLANKYRDKNLELHDDYVKAFEGVNEVIEKLYKAGIKLGVVTTKMRLTTDRGLKHVGIADYMGTVVTIDDVTKAKPDAEPVLKAMEALQANPKTTLMVGDSTMDIESGINAGVDTAGVAWSLKGEKVLTETGATYIIHHMNDILSIVGMENR